MDVLEFLIQYKKHFPEASPEQAKQQIFEDTSIDTYLNDKLERQDGQFTLVQSIYIRLNENQVLEANINSPNKVDEAIEFWRKCLRMDLEKHV
jgi:hypothetical protein